LYLIPLVACSYRMFFLWRLHLIAVPCLRFGASHHRGIYGVGRVPAQRPSAYSVSECLVQRPCDAANRLRRQPARAVATCSSVRQQIFVQPRDGRRCQVLQWQLSDARDSGLGADWSSPRRLRATRPCAYSFATTVMTPTKRHG
jgi:hypothetical protein